MVTDKSWAAILVEPEDKVPKGIRMAVEVVTLIVAPLTVPELAAATVKVRVGSTEAVTAIEVEVRIAKATVAVSITVVPVSE